MNREYNLFSEFEIEEERKKLKKKYQEEPNILLKEYDEVIKESIIGIIANFNTTDILRVDIIKSINDLIVMRQFIVEKYCSNSSSNN